MHIVNRNRPKKTVTRLLDNNTANTFCSPVIGTLQPPVDRANIFEVAFVTLVAIYY